MTIELLNPIFYRGGESGVSEIVGNDWLNGDEIGRVARYSFTVPVGAQSLSMTFHTSGKHDGAHIPIRFYVGTDPDSHANAGPDSECSGELTLGDDWLTFTAETEILLLPGVTYYLWLFPGSNDYGHYTWYRTGYVSTMETEGAASVVHVKQAGELSRCLVYCVYKGALWLSAVYIVRGGKLCLCSTTTQ